MASMLRLARTRTVRICLGCEADQSENRQCCSDVLQTCLKPRSWRQGAFFAVLCHQQCAPCLPNQRKRPARMQAIRLTKV